MIGWALLAGVIVAVLVGSALEEVKLRRRQETKRAAAKLRRPPAHPNCRCVTVPLDVGPLTGHINLDELLHDVSARIRRDLGGPTEAEVNAVLEELERLSSSTE